MFYKFKQLNTVILSLFFSAAAFCGEVIHSHVSYEKGVYKATLEMQIHAPSHRVYALFTDYDHLYKLSSNITESILLEKNPPEFVVEIETHNCVLFFCKNLTQTQHVLELGDGFISVEDVVDESDFVFANTVWHIRAFEGGTRVTFNSEMKPDFWLPPLLGPWIFKDKMIADTHAMIEQLEHLATTKQPAE